MSLQIVFCNLSEFLAVWKFYFTPIMLRVEIWSRWELDQDKRCLNGRRGRETSRIEQPKQGSCPLSMDRVWECIITFLFFPLLGQVSIKFKDPSTLSFLSFFSHFIPVKKGGDNSKHITWSLWTALCPLQSWPGVWKKNCGWNLTKMGS